MSEKDQSGETGTAVAEKAPETSKAEVQNQIIRIVATHSRFEIAPEYICPGFDEETKTYITGSENASDVVKAKAKQLFLRDNGEVESFPLRHGMTFNMKIPYDAAIANLARISGICAPTKKEGIPAKFRYYIENKDEEANLEVSLFEKQTKAWELVKKGCSLPDMIDLCRMLGKSTAKLSARQVEGVLIKECQNNPNNIISMMNHPERKSKIYITRLVRKGIILEVSGVYKYGEITLGTSFDKTIEWFKAAENRSLVKQINDLLKETED